MVAIPELLADLTHMHQEHESIIESHLAWCKRRNLRPTTIYNRRLTLTRVTRLFLCDLLDATPEQFAAWWDNHHASPAARKVDLSHIRSFYRWAIDEEITTVDPTRKLVTPKTQRGLPRPMSEERARAALDYAPERIKPWIALAGWAGLRGCEVATLRAEDIREDLGLIVVREGKGGKSRTVPLHPIVIETLKGAPSSGYLFRKVHRTDEPVNAALVVSLANRWLRRIGADGSFHSLRHRFATQVYAASNDLRVTQELLGHSSPATTAIYTQWSSTKAQSAVQSI